MRFCTVQHDGIERACVAHEGDLVDLAALAIVAGRAGMLPPRVAHPLTCLEAASDRHSDSIREILTRLTGNEDEFRSLADEEGLPLILDPGAVTWAAPVTAPGKIICVGLNYKDHAEEQGAKLPEEPLLFAKFANTLRGHLQTVDLPEISQKVDLEAELGLVIGRSGRHIPVDRADGHILGYTIVNDVSARDLQSRDRQWFRAKSCDGFAPMGPYLVTRDDVPDPMDLDIESYLNDFRMQSSNTRNLIFNVYELVAFASRALTLEPGDIISTGTPAGVGVFRNPPIFLKDGDRMTLRIERMGELANPVRRSGA
jgi:acylpyruvate hydrolase